MRQVTGALYVRPGVSYDFMRDGFGQLFGARLAPRPASATPGEVLDAGGDGLVVACGEGAVRVLQVQPTGRKRMAGADWQRGRGIAIGDRFDATG